MYQKNRVALVILDGFGHAYPNKFNAISQAQTPHIDSWLQNYPHTLLHASGKYVGLPEGFCGNSEVGHLTLGTGRVISQPLTIINNAITDGSFYTNPSLVTTFEQISKGSGRLHIMGLLSDGGVHSHTAHLYAYLDAARAHNIPHIFIHSFLDGRDTAPRSAERYLDKLDGYIKQYPQCSLGSIHGRFYAMDRDENWERTQTSYTTLTQTQKTPTTSWQQLLKTAYASGTTDEFIYPTQLNQQAVIQQGDGILYFNFRPDRSRQLARCFLRPGELQFITKKAAITPFITPTFYGLSYPTKVLFAQQAISNTLKDVISAYDNTIFAIAETEKYAHISYFFNGEREEILPGESQVLIQSIATKTYAEHPYMSARLITQTVIDSMRNDSRDFYLINYANADMVGHSGNFAATVKAVECLDEQLHELYQCFVLEMGGTLIITADHGKAEDMFDETNNQPKTSHTTNQVPCISISNQHTARHTLDMKQLADVAPYILRLMHLPIPTQMQAHLKA